MTGSTRRADRSPTPSSQRFRTAHTSLTEKLDLLGLERNQADPALLTFLDSPDLQGAIRSCTGCYHELGESLVNIVGTDDALLHILSDQQWTKHWLVYCSAGPHRGVVLAADLPYGFDTTDEYEAPVPTPLAVTMPSDLTLVADSFEEFLKRFYLENEISFSTVSGDAGFESEQVERYADQLRRP